jgi:hypothetical protein
MIHLVRFYANKRLLQTVDNVFAVGRDIHYNNNYYMEPLRITKVIQVGSSLAIILPKPLLHAVDFQRGDQVFLAVREDLSISIKKVDIKIIS